jgi:hypothetical protein
MGVSLLYIPSQLNTHTFALSGNSADGVLFWGSTDAGESIDQISYPQNNGFDGWRIHAPLGAN